MIIIFEGMDATGKSVIEKAFVITNNYAYVTVVRMHLSCLVYADYYKRPSPCTPAGYRRFLKDNDALVVYLVAEEPVLRRRIISRGEKYAEQPRDSVVRALFWQYYQVCVPKPRWCVIDTTRRSVPEVVKIIEAKIKSLEEKV